MEGEQKTALVLLRALANCRGIIQQTINGDTDQNDLKRVLDGSSEKMLISILGEHEYRKIADLWDHLSNEEERKLLGLEDD